LTSRKEKKECDILLKEARQKRPLVFKSVRLIADFSKATMEVRTQRNRISIVLRGKATNQIKSTPKLSKLESMLVLVSCYGDKNA
jgi:hypothetical protein